MLVGDSPILGFLFCLALGGDAGAECFRGLQPGCHVGQDARETCVVLWDGLGWRGKFGLGPPTESDARLFVCAKREWSHSDLR